MNRQTLPQGIANKYHRVFQDGYDHASQHVHKAVIAGVVLVVALCAWEFVAGDHGVLAQRKLATETARLGAENAGLQKSVGELSEQNRLLSTDDFMAEKAVREIHLRSKPGEIIYLFEENPGNTGSSIPMSSADVRVATRPVTKEKTPGE